MQFSQIIIGAVVGFGFSLIGGFIMWKVNQSDQWRRLRMDKMELLIRTIHKANQELRRVGESPAPNDFRDMEDLVNEISTIITLYFPTLSPLEHRLGKSLVHWMGRDDEALETFQGELRGLEQDAVTVFQGQLSIAEILEKLPPVK